MRGSDIDAGSQGSAILMQSTEALWSTLGWRLVGHPDFQARLSVDFRIKDRSHVNVRLMS